MNRKPTHQSGTHALPSALRQPLRERAAFLRAVAEYARACGEPEASCVAAERFIDTLDDLDRCPPSSKVA